MPLTGSLKRKKQYSSASDLLQHSDRCQVKSAAEGDEFWSLSDVVFVEDFKSSNVLGRVIKVDNDYVLVQVGAGGESSQAELVLDNSRIFQKSQLQLVKQSSSSSSKLPDFMQRTPKRLSEFGPVLALAAHQNGLHAIVTKENSLMYVQYDLLSNKITKEKRFTTSLNSFLGKGARNVSFFAQDEPSVSASVIFSNL